MYNPGNSEPWHIDIHEIFRTRHIFRTLLKIQEEVFPKNS